jgi:alkanesulfonate monooxygenase SsuD/methylene tetrahydromethanopterin reductase-like flavin-dependent oxidoreductase (luciferase family)
VTDQVAMAAPAGDESAAALGAFLASGHPVPSSIAAASQRTRPLRFANMVNILPFRNPLLVAAEAAMLDNLTEGRLDLGLGRGLRSPEFETFGVPAKGRNSRADPDDVTIRTSGTNAVSPTSA